LIKKVLASIFGVPLVALLIVYFTTNAGCAY